MVLGLSMIEHVFQLFNPGAFVIFTFASKNKEG